MDSKHNIEKLGEKLEKCRNMKLEYVTLDDVDELSSIKLIEENQVMREFLIF